MNKIKTDTHVHSIFTNHAYSTIEENAAYANSFGMECIAITDHFGPLFIADVRDAAFHLYNRVVLPEYIRGVRVLKGIEMDIVGFDGTLAFSDIPSPLNKDYCLSEHLLRSCELAIASVHQTDAFQGGTIAEHTEMYCNVLRNPYIDILGHSGRSGMEYEIDEVLKVAKMEGKLIEINNHSFHMGERAKTCKTIAERCAELGVFITVSSDAHYSGAIGDYQDALTMLEEIHFPEELIANINQERLFEHIRLNKKKIE